MTLRTYYLAFAAASAFGLFAAAAPASAQNGGQYVDDPAYDEQYEDPGSADDAAMDDEAPADTADYNDAAADEGAAGEDTIETAYDEGEVVVTAPRIRVERGAMLQPPGKYRLRRAVAYDDLDLRTREGARELKERVRATASEICEELASIDRPSSYDYAVCYREAVANAIPRANSAIEDARSYAAYDE